MSDGVDEIWNAHKLGIRQHSAHLSILDLDVVQDLKDKLGEKFIELYDIEHSLSVPLTCAPLYQADQLTLKSYREILRSFISSEPLLCTLVNINLESCLQDRIKRFKRMI